MIATHSRRTTMKLFAGAAASGLLPAAATPASRNVIVFAEAGRFGGWPANHGIWSWGDEIVVGFRAGHFKRTAQGHAIDREKPAEEWQARSKNGGDTWLIEKPRGLVPPKLGGKDPVDCPGGLDFSHPGMALMFRSSNGKEGESRFYYSQDRAQTWQGPYRVPGFGQPGIDARTDYLVNGKHDLSALITVRKQNGREGRVMLIRTTDGGRSWRNVSWVGPEPEGFAIMSSSLRLSGKRILTTIRRKEKDENWIEAWLSEDDGGSWRFLNRPAPSTGASSGNPPSLLRLKDGRLCLIYGYRAVPFGMRARLSSDEGRNWGEEIHLRDDAGCWDLGYPRSVQRTDGKVFTAYYYNDHPDRERYIAGTIWQPPAGRGAIGRT